VQTSQNPVSREFECTGHFYGLPAIRPSEALGIQNAASGGETLGGVNLNQYCLWEGDLSMEKPTSTSALPFPDSDNSRA